MVLRENIANKILSDNNLSLDIAKALKITQAGVKKAAKENKKNNILLNFQSIDVLLERGYNKSEIIELETETIA